MNEALESLVAIIELQKKISDTSYQDALSHWRDYKVFLEEAEELWCVRARRQNCPFVPLAEIDVGEAVYKMAVDKAYGKDVEVTPPPLSPASHFEKYIENLKRKHNTDVGLEDAEHTKEDVEKIWNSILNPPSLVRDGEEVVDCEQGDNLDELRRKRGKTFGLVVGRVQSGKTRNYIGLVLKAFDEGWNTAIILTSNNTALADQTFNRMGNTCGEVKLDVHQFDFRSGVPKETWLDTGKYVGFAQKEIHHLGNIRQWLQALSDEQLSKMRLLVIDDESDNATPDTQQSAESIDETDIPVIASCLQKMDVKVAEWVQSLRDIDIGERAIDIGLTDSVVVEDYIGQISGVVGNWTAQNDIEEHFLNPDDIVARLLGVDVEVEDEAGQKTRLANLIWNVMRYRRNRRNHFYDNRTTLLALVKYVFGIGVERSRINHLVTSLFSFGSDSKNRNDTFSFGSMAYVGYTATPYANVLNETPERDPLASDFMYPMQVSRHYMGLERIFGASGGDRTKPNMGIVNSFASDERDLLDMVRSDTVGEENVSPDLFVTWRDVSEDELTMHDDGELDEEQCQGDGEEVTQEWISLKNAIAWLFCTAAARRLRRLRISQGNAILGKKKENRWTTMLFNITLRTSLHDKLRGIVSNFLEWIVDNRDVFEKLCECLWRQTEEGRPKLFTKDSFNEACANSGLTYGNDADDYATWNEIKSELAWYLDHIRYNVHAIVINKTPDGRRGLEEYRGEDAVYRNSSEDHLWIVVGGNTLARGLTLDGLTVTYFDRVGQTSAVDTVEQMGRWFGYREGYELLPRIWMPLDSIGEFKDMARIERALHLTLKHKYEDGCSPKIKEHYAQVMIFGRMLSGRTAAMEYRGDVWLKQGTFRQFYSDKRGDAIGIASKFVGMLGNQTVRSQSRYKAQGSGAVHKYHAFPYWRDVASSKIKEFLSDLTPITPVETRNRIHALLRALDYDTSQPWDVVIANAKGRNMRSDDSVNIGGLMICKARATCTRSEHGIIEFGKYTGQEYAFFSGIKTIDITNAEAKQIQIRIDNNEIPDGWNSEMVKTEIERAVSSSDEIAPALRSFYGFSRMSDEEYRDSVFQEIAHDSFYDNPNPVLQISLIVPSKDDISGLQDIGVPFVSVSFYRPGCDDRYRIVAPSSEVDEEHIQLRIGPTEGRLREEIDKLLSYYGFLSKSVIRKMLADKFGIEVELTKKLQDGRGRYETLHGGQYFSALPSYEVMYSTKWYEELVGDVPAMSVEDCILWQLEAEAKDVIRMSGGCLTRAGGIERGMMEHFPYRAGIIVTDRGREFDRFDDMFVELFMSGKISSFGFSGHDSSPKWVLNEIEEAGLFDADVESPNMFERL